MLFDVTKDLLKWQHFMDHYPIELTDVCFDPIYANSYEMNGDGQLYCALFVGENGMRLLYPFLLTKVPDYGLITEYYNISSYYGYGGPLIDSFSREDMYFFEELFGNWCKDNKIIAEFIRFHPLLHNYDKFTNNIVVEENRQTIKVNLQTSFEQIWQHSITGKNRNQIRKAQKSGVTIRQSTGIEAFINIYKQTMNRLNADDYYYFNQEYFHQLSKLFPSNMIILEAVYKEEIIASSIFIFKGANMYYHLSGSIREYLHLCPNNLILFEAIIFGMKNRFKVLYLGGGTTNSRKDSLYKFKKSFSPSEEPFYIGKRVHNQDIYNTLMTEWQEIHKKEAKLFLQYELVDKKE